MGGSGAHGHGRSHGHSHSHAHRAGHAGHHGMHGHRAGGGAFGGGGGSMNRGAFGGGNLHHHHHHRGGGGVGAMFGLQNAAVIGADGRLSIAWQIAQNSSECCAKTVEGEFTLASMPAAAGQILSQEECQHVCACLNAAMAQHLRPCVGWFGGLCFGMCIFMCLQISAAAHLNAHIQQVCSELTEEFAARDIVFANFGSNVITINAAVTPAMNLAPAVVMVGPLAPMPQQPYYGGPMVYAPPTGQPMQYRSQQYQQPMPNGPPPAYWNADAPPAHQPPSYDQTPGQQGAYPASAPPADQEGAKYGTAPSLL